VKFGKLESHEELRGMDWELPAARVEWGGLMPSCKTVVRTGGTMWTVRPWRGSVYPRKEPMRTWPSYYGKQFGSLEFNATHYRIYSEEKMASWADEMPNDCVFCPKFPAIISHYRRFANCEGPTDDFIRGLVALGDNLGPAFLQLPPHYAPKHSTNLIPYLKAWPRELKMAIEFRHPEWFTGGDEAERVWALLSELGIGAVISDTAGRRDALHMRLTAPFLIVRFGGYDGHASDEIRVKNWVNKISDLSAKGLESFDFLVHTTDSVHTPDTCQMFSEIVKSTCDIDVKAPTYFGE
jgi:uncharacterized protein YecE (DUF72 family)